MFRSVSQAMIALGFLGCGTIAQVANAAEVCDEGAETWVKGTISKIEDKSDGSGKPWVLRPTTKSDVQSSCLSLSEAIAIEGATPTECRPGAKFTLSGTIKNGSIARAEVRCYYPYEEGTGDPRKDCSDEGGPDIKIFACTKLIKKNPEEIEPYIIRGNAYSILDMYDLAIADFSQIIKINPNWGPAYINRANNYLISDRLDDAITDATKALKINKGKAILNDFGRGKAHVIRGYAYKLQGKANLAAADLQAALKFDPINFQATYQLADLYMSEGKRQQAIAVLTDAISAQPVEGLPDAVALYRLRGFAHFSMKHFKEAGADFAQSIEQGASGEAIFFRFIAYTRSGEDATKDLRESFPLFVGPDKWQRQVADLFLGDGQPDGILDAARFWDKTCLAALYLGEWHLLKGNEDKSREFFEQASRECPEHSSAGYVAAAELGR